MTTDNSERLRRFVVPGLDVPYDSRIMEIRSALNFWAGQIRPPVTPAYVMAVPAEDDAFVRALADDAFALVVDYILEQLLDPTCQDQFLGSPDDTELFDRLSARIVGSSDPQRKLLRWYIREACMRLAIGLNCNGSDHSQKLGFKLWVAEAQSKAKASRYPRYLSELFFDNADAHRSIIRRSHDEANYLRSLLSIAEYMSKPERLQNEFLVPLQEFTGKPCAMTELKVQEHRNRLNRWCKKFVASIWLHEPYL